MPINNSNQQLNTRERDAKVFKVFIPKREAYKRSVLYKGAVEWNNIEVETRNINSYLAFKNKHNKLDDWHYI